MSTIGLKIRKLREAKDFTQDYMAERLNISQNVYSRIESGHQKLTTERLSTIANILEVSQENLLNDDLSIFNVYNNTIDKFYIQTLKEENKDLLQKHTDQIDFLKNQNAELLKIIELAMVKNTGNT